MKSLFSIEGYKHINYKTSFTNHFFLAIISVAFVLSDWMLSYFSFSELLLMPIIFSLFFFKKIRISIHQFKWLLIPLSVVCLNTMVHYLTNANFDIRLALASTIKLVFYISTVIILYNYIKRQNLEKPFIFWLNICAMIICLIAVYIAIAIYLDGAIPWRFFVTFTRTGGNVFRRDPLIVRAKSIFMEPAHLGYYLNSVLAINLLNKNRIKIPLYFSAILVLIITLTFSYSAIGVMIVVISLNIVKLYGEGNLKINKVYLLTIGIISIIFITVFRESINVTLIDRTIRLFQGDESSGYERLILSWQYVNWNNLLIGNGILHTPPVWNNFAYIQSDFGIIGTILMIISTVFISKKNIYLGVFFIAMNFVKGGYLSPAYWFLIFIVILYSTVLEKSYKVGHIGKEDNCVK